MEDLQEDFARKRAITAKRVSGALQIHDVSQQALNIFIDGDYRGIYGLYVP